MAGFLRLIFCAFLFHYCLCIISLRTSKCITELIEDCKERKGRGFQGIIMLSIPILGNAEVQNEDFYMPSVILWNPYLVYPQFVQPGSIKCSHCGSPLYEGYWNDGSSASKQPRIIHGLDRLVLLVSAVYVCSNRHKIVSHDEIVLKHFPLRDIIPFYLLHRTGLTRDLVDTILSLCKRGVNFHGMESFVLERRWKTFARQQDLHRMHDTLLSQSSNLIEFIDTDMSKGPSNDILSKCFLAEFLEHEELYLHEMAALPVTKSIAFDHTFKVASNIGYFREDGKWITEYDALFIVLSENGHIITWQFTKGTSFSDIEKILEDLKIRAVDTAVKTIYIDDCCKLKAKLKRVFGADIEVKLDLFHAVQRITKTLPKKHPLLSQCIRELRLVFRCDGDSGDKRLSPTPSPEVIEKKMDQFKERWSHKTDDMGVIMLLKPESLSAIERLMHHIRCGCLSNIPPGAGTNRNERLHEHINAYFNRSRIGVLLAYALLMVLFQAHNSTVRYCSKATSRPISASPMRNKMYSASPIIMGIIPKHQRQNYQGEDLWEIDLSDNTIDHGVIFPVYCRSIQKLRVVKALAKLNLAHLTDTIESFREFKASSFTDSGSSAELENILSTYSLTYSPTVRDGNCFFKAVALNILANAKNWGLFLNRIGFNDESLDLESLAMKLRHVFVEEITGVNHRRYSDFIVTEEVEFDYTIEAKKFLQNGFYASQFGDLMPPAMATALGASLIIFTTNQCNPIMYNNPLKGFAERAVFLIYHPSGSGHYDAAIPYSLSRGNDDGNTACAKVPVLSTRCRCGVNNNNKGKSCVQNPFYATRCKCYNNSKPCSSSCSCKECGNPFGIRPLKLAMPRKRRSHCSQEIPNSKRFAIERGESLSTRIWSTFESIVLKELMQVAEDDNLSKLYNDTVLYSKSSFCIVPLESDTVFREKTKTQIDSKLFSIKKCC